MAYRKSWRLLVYAGVSLLGLAAVAHVVELTAVLEAFGRLPPSFIAVSAGLLVANLMLAILRFASVLKAFDYTPPLREILRAFLVGQFANTFVFNVVGQSVSRAAVLEPWGVPQGVTLVATYWERLFAAGILFLLSLVSAWVLFLRVSFDLQQNSIELLWTATGLLVVAGFTMLLLRRRFGAGDAGVRALRKLVRLGPSVLLTLVMHACMLGAYLTVLLGLGNTEASASIVAAVVVTMFTASLPISFAGWGIRELSATQAMGAVGVPVSMAAATAVVIGLISLALTVGGVAVALFLYRRRASRSADPAPPGETVEDRLWRRGLIIGGVMLTPFLLFFQMQVPLQSGDVTVNLADIAAMTALGLAVVSVFRTRSFRPAPPALVGGVAAVTVAIAVGLAVGGLRFGSNDWALFNRGLGWLVILGYVAAGSAAALLDLKRDVPLVLSSYIVGGMAVAGIQLLLVVAAVTGVNLQYDLLQLPVSGYAGNYNAFAYQMVVLACAVVVARRLGLFDGKAWLYVLAFVTAGLSVYYSQSRAGYVAFLVVLAFAAAAPAAKRRRELMLLGLVVGGMLLFAVTAHFAGQLVLALRETGVSPYFTSKLLPKVSGGAEESDALHWRTLVDGFAMWSNHPVFGAGLGAYVQNQLATGPGYVVMHSIPVWILAEFGIFGFLLIGGSMLALTVQAAGFLRDPDASAWGTGLLILIACTATFGLAHDLFYQRFFWYFLGFYSALGGASGRWRLSARM